MSDLHCAARVLLACPGDAEFEAAALGRSLVGERLALVYTAPQSRAVQTAEIVAARTGASVVVREGLRDGSVVAELDAIVDVHRGETVLVVLPGTVLRASVAALVGLREGPVGSPPAACQVVELAADADGWVLRTRVDVPIGAEETVET